MSNPYETLGVERTAGADEIKQAWRRASSAAHPDREGGSNEQQAAVNAAYEVLSDPARRARFDSTGDVRPAKPANEAAKDALLSILNQILDNDAVDNVIDEARRHFQSAKSVLGSSIAELSQRRKKLAKRRAKVKVRAGDNLVHMLIDRKLLSTDAQMEAAKRDIGFADGALKILDDYESAEEAEPTGPLDDPFIRELLRGGFRINMTGL